MSRHRHEAAAAVGVPSRVVTGPVERPRGRLRRGHGGGGHRLALEADEPARARLHCARRRGLRRRNRLSSFRPSAGSRSNQEGARTPRGRFRVARARLAYRDPGEGMNLDGVVGLHVGADEVEGAEQLLNRYLRSGIGSIRLETVRARSSSQRWPTSSTVTSSHSPGHRKSQSAARSSSARLRSTRCSLSCSYRPSSRA